MATRHFAIGTRSFGKTVSPLRKPTPCTRRTATSWGIFLRKMSGLFAPLYGQGEFLVSCRYMSKLQLDSTVGIDSDGSFW